MTEELKWNYHYVQGEPKAKEGRLIDIDIVKVQDGDTVYLDDSQAPDILSVAEQNDDGLLPLRLAGVDCPEYTSYWEDGNYTNEGDKKDANGEDAFQFTYTHIQDRQVKFDVRTDGNGNLQLGSYNRPVGIIYFQLPNGRWVNLNRSLMMNNLADPSYIERMNISDEEKGRWQIQGESQSAKDVYKEYVSTLYQEDKENLIAEEDDHDFQKEVKIGDTILPIPPEQISTKTINEVTPKRTLRNGSTMMNSSGHNIKQFTLDFYVNGKQGIDGSPRQTDVDVEVDGEVINPVYFMHGLRSLMAQFRLTPFLPVQNHYLNYTHDTNAVTLQNMTVSNVQGFPHLLKVSLTVMEFNYQVYVNTNRYFADIFNWDMFRFYYQRLIEGTGLNPDCEDKLPRYESSYGSADFSFDIAKVHSLQKREDAENRLDNILRDYQINLTNGDTIYEKIVHDMEAFKQADAQRKRLKELRADGLSGYKLKNEYSEYVFNMGEDSDKWEFDRELYSPDIESITAPMDTVKNNRGKKLEPPYYEIPVRYEHNQRLILSYIEDNPTTDSFAKHEGLKEDRSIEEFYRDQDEPIEFTAYLNHEDYKVLRPQIVYRGEDVEEGRSEAIKNSEGTLEQDYEYETVDFDTVHLQNVAASMSNRVISTKISMQTSPAHQYLGSKDIAFEMSFYTRNQQDIREFVMFLEKTKAMQLRYNHVIDRPLLKLNNNITDLFGTDGVYIKEVNTKTVPGQPNLYVCEVSLIGYYKPPEDFETLSRLYKSEIALDTSADDTQLNNYFKIKEMLNEVNLYPDLRLPKYNELPLDSPLYDEDNRSYVDPDFYALNIDRLFIDKIARALKTNNLSLISYGNKKELSSDEIQEDISVLVDEDADSYVDDNKTTKPGDMVEWPSDFFTKGEFLEKSEVTELPEMTENFKMLLVGLDELQRKLGKDVKISNAIRETNEKHPKSYHLAYHYCAADIYVPGMTSRELIEVVEENDLFTGRGFYPGDHFVHVDTRRGLRDENISRWYRDRGGTYHESGIGPNYGGEVNSTTDSSVPVEALKNKYRKDEEEETEDSFDYSYESLMDTNLHNYKLFEENELNKKYHGGHYDYVLFRQIRDDFDEDVRRSKRIKNIQNAVREGLDYNPRFDNLIAGFLFSNAVEPEKLDNDTKATIPDKVTHYNLPVKIFEDQHIDVIRKYNRNHMLTAQRVKMEFEVLYDRLSEKLKGVEMNSIIERAFGDMDEEQLKEMYSKYDELYNSSNMSGAKNRELAAELKNNMDNKNLEDIRDTLNDAVFTRRKIIAFLAMMVLYGYSFDDINQGKADDFLSKLKGNLYDAGATPENHPDVSDYEDIFNYQDIIDNAPEITEKARKGKMTYSDYSYDVPDNPLQTRPKGERFKQSFRDMIRYSKRGRLLQAFPSYYMLLIDEGDKVSFWNLQDVFYEYSGIQTIDLVRDKKNVADTCMIKLSNSRGKLSDATGGYDTKHYEMGVLETFNSLMPWSQIEWEIKKRESEYESVQLSTGARIHLRMGYGSNPNDLPTVFNGTITELQLGEQITFVAQNDGIELNKLINAGPKQTTEYEWFGSLQKPKEIITDILGNKGGLWNYIWNELSEVVGAENLLYNEHDYGLRHFGRIERPEYFDKAAALRKRHPQEEDEPRGYEIAQNINRSPYDNKFAMYLYGKTIWDVFTGTAMTVPNYITAVHPFGFRNTVFFGHPTMDFAYEYTLPVDDNGKYKRDAEGNINPSEMREKLKPYRQMHYIDSYNNIIANNIQNSERRMYTAVKPIYTAKDGETKELNTQFIDSDIFPSKQKLIRVDTGIAAPDILRGFAEKLEVAQEHEMIAAERYGRSALTQYVENMYGGSIVVRGNPTVKPHDYTFMFDLKNRMNGMFEVERVVHSLNQKMGFITSITPDPVVIPNANIKGEANSYNEDISYWQWAKTKMSHITQQVVQEKEIENKAYANFKNNFANDTIRYLTSAALVEGGKRTANYLGRRAIQRINDASYNILYKMLKTGEFFRENHATYQAKNVGKFIDEAAAYGSEGRAFIKSFFNTDADDFYHVVRNFDDVKEIYQASDNIYDYLRHSDIFRDLMRTGTQYTDDIVSYMTGGLLGLPAGIIGIGVELFIDYVITQKIGDWFKNKRTSRETMTIIPLTKGGEEFVSGIEGHQGAVVGDDPSNVDDLWNHPFFNFFFGKNRNREHKEEMAQSYQDIYEFMADLESESGDTQTKASYAVDMMNIEDTEDMKNEYKKGIYLASYTEARRRERADRKKATTEDKIKEEKKERRQDEKDPEGLVPRAEGTPDTQQGHLSREEYINNVTHQSEGRNYKRYGGARVMDRLHDKLLELEANIGSPMITTDNYDYSSDLDKTYYKHGAGVLIGEGRSLQDLKNIRDEARLLGLNAYLVGPNSSPEKKMLNIDLGPEAN